MFKFISKGIKSKGYGTKRYLGDIGKTVIQEAHSLYFDLFFTHYPLFMFLRGLYFFIFLLIQIERAGSKALFAVITEISDSVLRGAETNGFNGMVIYVCYCKFCSYLIIVNCAKTKLKYLLVPFFFRSKDFTKAY